MARAQKKIKEKVEVSTLSKVLTGVVALITVAILVLIIVIVVKLVQDNEENTNPFENYAIINSSDLNIVVEHGLNGYGNFSGIQNEKARNLLQTESKDIFILFFSSNMTNYGDSGESLHKEIVDLATQVDPGANGNVIFLLFDYNSDPTVFSSLLKPILEGTINIDATAKVPAYLRVKQNSEGFSFSYNPDTVKKQLTSIR